MQKSLLLVSIISASILFSAVALAQTEGSCTPQFSISSPESVSMSKTFVWVDITVTNTGSCEGSTTVYPMMPDSWYSSANFTTKTLQPGESDNSSIKIIPPDGASSATIQFAADGANSSQTKIVIGGIAPAENQTQTKPPVTSTPPVMPIKNQTIIAPQENPQPQPNETGAVQNQPEAVPTTGLVTSNPASQIAVFVILIFGAGYLAARIRIGGFRYRFKK
jgi:hypothetical protein